MIRRPPRSTRVRSSAASDVYKRQVMGIHSRINSNCQFSRVRQISTDPFHKSTAGIWIFPRFLIFSFRVFEREEPGRRRNHDLTTGSRALQTESARSRSPGVGGDDRRPDVAGAVRLGDGKRAGASRDARPASADETDARARDSGAESPRSVVVFSLSLIHI